MTESQMIETLLPCLGVSCLGLLLAYVMYRSYDTGRAVVTSSSESRVPCHDATARLSLRQPVEEKQMTEIMVDIGAVKEAI